MNTPKSLNVKLALTIWVFDASRLSVIAIVTICVIVRIELHVMMLLQLLLHTLILRLILKLLLLHLIVLMVHLMLMLLPDLVAGHVVLFELARADVLPERDR